MDPITTDHTNGIQKTSSATCCPTKMKSHQQQQQQQQQQQTPHPDPGRKMYIRTPLIESRPLSQHLSDSISSSSSSSSSSTCSVFLKLENTQPSGSFKLRGISHMMRKELERGCRRLVASSGGNAGLAAAYVAKQLHVPLTIYTPTSTGSQMLQRLRSQGATIVVHGDAWDEADAKAREEAKDPTVGYVPPFDHPDVWAGHESIMVEIAEDLPPGTHPDLVILSVGGGGLLVGVSQGMESVGWGNVPILAMETVGADCFNAAINAGHLVTLPAITSIAKCLGALTVASEAFRIHKTRPIISELVTDKESVEAISSFLDDHHILVEPACAAAISAIYSGTVRRLQKEGKLPSDLRTIVLIVCGGVSVNLEMLNGWRQSFGIE